MNYVVGCDQAGIGEIYGFAYFCAAVIPETQLQFLTTLNLKDSKKLSKIQIKNFVNIFKSKIKFIVLKVSPKVIDRINLSLLKLKVYKALVNKIVQRFKSVDSITIDCPWPNIEKFKKQFHYKIEAFHKADTLNLAVKAAAIYAKYLYNQHLLTLKNTWGQIGSGNLNDPLTKYYCFKNPNVWFIRKKWKIK